MQCSFHLKPGNLRKFNIKIKLNMLWWRTLVFKTKCWNWKVVSCLQGAVLSFDPIILYHQNPFMENLELLGQAILSSTCLVFISNFHWDILLLLRKWGGGGQRQWSPCPNWLAVSGKLYKTALYIKFKSVPLIAECKGNWRDTVSPQVFSTGCPSDLFPWSQAPISAHGPHMWPSQETYCL